MSKSCNGACPGERPSASLAAWLAAVALLFVPPQVPAAADAGLDVGSVAGAHVLTAGAATAERAPAYAPYPGEELVPAPDGAGNREAGEPYETPADSSASPDGDSTPAAMAPGDPGDGKELSSDLVYAVLLGEIASQREDHRRAYSAYMQAAQLAGDAGMVELAARAALSAGDPKSAVRAAQLWTEIEPDSPRARQIGAYARIDAGDRAGALAELDELIRLTADPGQGYIQAAQMLSRVADPAQRVQMMRDLVARDIDDANAQFALAMLASGASDPEAAREHAERAARLRPDWNTPRVFLVRLLDSQDRRDEAAAVLDEFIAADPADQELLLLRAQLQLDAEEYEEALAVFDAVLDRAPDQPDVLVTAALVALEVESIDRARDYLVRLRKTGARADDSAFLLGQVEELAGETGLALDWYAKVRGENATNARVRSAGIYAGRGEIERAREILQQLRDQFPADVTSLYLIEGELLRERDLHEQAIDVYSNGLQARPGDPDLLYARAMLAVGMDRVDLLERDLRRILVGDPDHVDALNALGYTLADRTDRLDEAQRLIERALQLRPDEPAILDSMGWVLFRRGDAEGAEPYLRQALDAVFDPEIAAHLGEVLWTQGKEDEARQVWERALAEDPKHEYLLRTVGRYRITQSGR